MRLYRRTFIKSGGAAVLSGLAPRAWAADQPSPKDLAGDIDIMRQALGLHPGLYRYNSPTEIAHGVERLRARFSRSATLSERYLMISRFLAQIRCGHSYCNFFNQRSPVAASLFDRHTRLPFQFVWIGETMVVVGEGGDILPRGTEILAINGEPSRQLLVKLLPYVRADGHNDGKRVSLLEVNGRQKIETFDVFQGLLAPPSGNGHLLSVIRPREGLKVIEAPAISLDDRRKQKLISSKLGLDGQPWSWERSSDNIAILTMPSWALYDSKWDWNAWLDERLDSLENTRGLIVDLRVNEGGDDCGNPLLERLIDRPFVPMTVEQRLRFRRTPASIDKFLDTWDQSFRTLGEGAEPLPNGYYRRPTTVETTRIAPRGRRIKSPVIALISPVNSSATFQFAQNFRAIGAGKLIGRTTGGNRRGINGGCFFFVRLPASGIEFDLPLVGYFPTEPQPDAGLAPDQAIDVSKDDIIANRDPVMERARAILLAQARI